MVCDVAIIGAGPVGLFSVFELGLLGLNSVVIDTLDRPGGQCTELYPEKPIYDIPAYPKINGQELTDRLMEQIEPFQPTFLLSRRVDKLEARESDEGLSAFRLTTGEGDIIDAAAVFIAAGAGSFTPRRPKLGNLEEFENQSVFYAVKDRSYMRGKRVVIAGGGDSALDWTLALLDDNASVTLVHRSKRFRAHPASVDAMLSACEDGRITFIEGELHSLHGSDGNLTEVHVKTSGGDNPIAIPTDILLPFFGLNIELGPIANWGMDLQDGKLIKVDTECFQSSIPGVFAVGDINTYPGKLKLILSGFHECALAAQAAFRCARPGERLRFQYTTSSTELKKKLKVLD